VSAQERVSASTVEIAEDGFDDFGRRAKGGRKDKTAKEIAALARLQSNYGFLMNPQDAASALSESGKLGQFEDALESKKQPPPRSNHVSSNMSSHDNRGDRSSGQDRSDARRRGRYDDDKISRGPRDHDSSSGRRGGSRSRSGDRERDRGARDGRGSDRPGRDKDDDRYWKSDDREGGSRRRSRSREKDSSRGSRRDDNSSSRRDSNRY
jgi:transcription termination factor Rho